MAFQIRIAPAALHAAANRCHSIAEKAAEGASELASLGAELADGWDGSASGQALDALQEIRKAVDGLAEATHGGAKKLEGVAQAFEALDGGGSPVFAVDVSRLHIMVGCPMPTPQFVLNVVDNLRIIPDQVRAVADRLVQVSERFVQTGAMLNQTVDSLGGDWEGRAYTRFTEDMVELVDSYRQVSMKIDDYANRIRMIADRYEELDETLRNMF